MVVDLLLAAHPASPPPTSDALTPLYILIGTSVVAQVGALAFGFLRWLGARTVEREDADKKAIFSRLDEQDEQVRSIEKTVDKMESELRRLLGTMSDVSGTVKKIADDMDGRFEKQGAFYRNEIKEALGTWNKQLEELEIRLKQDMSRAMHDAQTLSSSRRKR